MNPRWSRRCSRSFWEFYQRGEIGLALKGVRKLRSLREHRLRHLSVITIGKPLHYMKSTQVNAYNPVEDHLAHLSSYFVGPFPWEGRIFRIFPVNARVR